MKDVDQDASFQPVLQLCPVFPLCLLCALQFECGGSHPSCVLSVLDAVYVLLCVG